MENTQADPLPTEDDFIRFCEEHGCRFFKMGDPDDWNRTDVFRVAYLPRGQWKERGATIEVAKVVEWLKDPPRHYEI